MKFFLIGLVIVSFALNGCQPQPSAKGEVETELSYSKFVNPPVEYRSYPFYSLNDRIEAEELKRQIFDFKNAGYGGFYLHSRVGLLTPYLGDEWWDVMDVAVEAALETGLQAYFYDEDRWPSGYAGGIIPEMGESYRSQLLARLDKDTSLPVGATLLKENEQYRYIAYTAQMGYANFNGTSYVDLMNPKVVEAFIDVTHRQYIERFADVLPYSFAIFSDEPHIHARYFDSSTPHQGVVSYSPYVRERFTKMFGYDFLDKVELLFEEKDNWREIRLHYQQAVARQFELSFSKQIGDFCEKHNVKFTGHYLGEDSYGRVAQRIGNSMLHYRNMQIPGIDLLGMSVANRSITARNLTSVANQYGIPRRMSELYGISGHNMSFEDRKRIANWHVINGINHFVPHLTWYSMKGTRKRDYPPTFSYHQPYWSYNKIVEDYLGRISYATNIGTYLPQILVVTPMESEYIKAADEFNFSEGILRLIEDLQRFNYDYDLGDEEIMADIGQVNGSHLQVGEMSYSMVVIPDMIGIRQSTIELLLEFANAGGILIHYGDRFPEFVEGKSGNNHIEKLKEAITFIGNKEDLQSALNQLLPPNVDISGDPEGLIWSHVRKSGDGYLIQLANTSEFDKIQFSVDSRYLDDKPVLWEPSEGLCYELSVNAQGQYDIALPPSSMVWLTSGHLSGDAKITGVYQLPEQFIPVGELKNEWQGTRLDPNAITLDFASYSLNNGNSWSDPEPVIGIHERLTNQGYNGLMRLKYRVRMDYLPEDIKLVVEQPGIYENIKINDHQISFNNDQYYVDRQFLSTPVASFVTTGENFIELTVDYSAPVPTSSDPYEKYGTEIESIYLIGDFAVYGQGYNKDSDTQRNQTGLVPERPVHIYEDFIISKENMRFTGDLTLEGYPFYAGAFELQQTFNFESLNEDNRYALKFPDHEAIVVIAELNGQVFQPLTNSPYLIDVTEFIREGENHLKLTFVNSLRNLMGPHHHIWKEMVRVGPSSFSGSGGFPSPRGVSDWYDQRKESRNVAYWRDDYHFIPFGLLEPVQICMSVK